MLHKILVHKCITKFFLSVILNPKQQQKNSTVFPLIKISFPHLFYGLWSAD